jgi:hypothetical protein
MHVIASSSLQHVAVMSQNVSNPVLVSGKSTRVYFIVVLMLAALYGSHNLRFRGFHDFQQSHSLIRAFKIRPTQENDCRLSAQVAGAACFSSAKLHEGIRVRMRSLALVLAIVAAAASKQQGRDAFGA